MKGMYAVWMNRKIYICETEVLMLNRSTETRVNCYTPRVLLIFWKELMYAWLKMPMIPFYFLSIMFSSPYLRHILKSMKIVKFKYTIIKMVV